VKYLLLTPLLLLVACSSPSGRAPVYDVKSNKSSSGSRYVASGQSVKPGQKQYVVAKGDTLYSIAWRAGLNVNTLIARNNLKKPYVIKQGQVLQLQNKAKKQLSVSQKKQKQTAISCSGQSCTKNKKIKVVKKSSKTYSDGLVAKSETKKQPSQAPASTNKVDDWIWPSKGKLTKTFANSVQGMKGISISNSRGTPIYAAAAGEVVYAGNGLRGYGNLIIIKHNYDYLSAYAHSDKLLIKEGEKVKARQKIAEMGDSGTDSVYLHFDIRFRGKSVDPLRYLPKR